MSPIDLKKSFDETTGFPVSQLGGIDFAALGENLDVAALATAKPEEIVVPPHYRNRENYYAAALIALAYRKGALGPDPAVSQAGANLAASFFRFTQEPIYTWQEPQQTRDDSVSKPGWQPLPSYMARRDPAYPVKETLPPPPQQTAEEKTDALFETMRAALATATRGTPAYVPTNQALFEFEEAGRTPGK